MRAVRNSELVFLKNSCISFKAMNRPSGSVSVSGSGTNASLWWRFKMGPPIFKHHNAFQWIQSAAVAAARYVHTFTLGNVICAFLPQMFLLFFSSKLLDHFVALFDQLCSYSVKNSMWDLRLTMLSTHFYPFTFSVLFYYQIILPVV